MMKLPGKLMFLLATSVSALFSLLTQESHAFISLNKPAIRFGTTGRKSIFFKFVEDAYPQKWQSPTTNQIHSSYWGPKSLATSSSSSTTSLFMYNLPPSGGNNNNDLGNILKGVGGIALVVLFFSSPLGGLVLGFFNSLLLLSILLPMVGTVGFKVWEYFNTITGPCPNCAAPVRVMKTNAETGEAFPSICYNCGAIIQSNYDNSAIDNITGRKSIDGLSPYGGNIFDIFGGAPTSYTQTTTTTIIEEKPTRNPRKSSDTTIIDVEIEDIDKPFQ